MFSETVAIMPFLFLAILEDATMIEQVLGDSAEDPDITSRGEIDEIQDESIPSVEAEKDETEPLGSPITPAGLEE